MLNKTWSRTISDMDTCFTPEITFTRTLFQIYFPMKAFTIMDTATMSNVRRITAESICIKAGSVYFFSTVIIVSVYFLGYFFLSMIRSCVGCMR